jgi:hypothetical protein
MDVQRIIALAIVGVAAAYLGRCFLISARAFFSSRSGCGGGCAKCAFAQEVKSRSQSTARRSDIIPLMEVRTLPKRPSGG